MKRKAKTFLDEKPVSKYARKSSGRYIYEGAPSFDKIRKEAVTAAREQGLFATFSGSN